MTRKIYTEIKFKKIKSILNSEFSVTINSNSMEPWIYTDEKIKAKVVSIDDLKKHDIIIYWNQELEILVCHIFVSITNGKLNTRSFKRNEEDKPTPINHFLGVVTSPQFKWYQKLLFNFYRVTYD